MILCHAKVRNSVAPVNYKKKKKKKYFNNIST